MQTRCQPGRDSLPSCPWVDSQLSRLSSPVPPCSRIAVTVMQYRVLLFRPEMCFSSGKAGTVKFLINTLLYFTFKTKPTTAVLLKYDRLWSQPSTREELVTWLIVRFSGASDGTVQRKIKTIKRIIRLFHSHIDQPIGAGAFWSSLA